MCKQVLSLAEKLEQICTSSGAQELQQAACQLQKFLLFLQCKGKHLEVLQQHTEAGSSARRTAWFLGVSTSAACATQQVSVGV